MTQEQTKTLRVSKLPEHIQETAAKLDTNQDGELEAQEVIGAISDLQKTQKTNQNLQKTIALFVVLTAVLASSVFGASVAAARLAKDVTIDQDTGFALVKGSSTKEVMKTQEAIVYRRGVSIGGMSNQELANLKVLSLQDGDLQFDVKGYARNSMEGTVMLLVEGGTLTYNNKGIASSTGDVRLLLEATFGPDIHVEGSDGQRRLVADRTTTETGFSAGSDAAHARQEDVVNCGCYDPLPGEVVCYSYTCHVLSKKLMDGGFILATYVTYKSEVKQVSCSCSGPPYGDYCSRFDCSINNYQLLEGDRFEATIYASNGLIPFVDSI